MEKTQEKRLVGSIPGFAITVAIGFALYFFLNLIGGKGALTYNAIIENITRSPGKQVAWLFMNFTEPQFYAGIFSGIAVILGGIVAWRLALRNSKFAGFDICYGSSSLFPWVLASQLLSAGLSIFVFRYINLFNLPDTTWVATFVSIVGAPPSVILLYGGSMATLLTASILGGLLCAPVATFISTAIVGPLGAPGVVSNVLAMAVTGTIICFVCKALPWIKAAPVKAHRQNAAAEENVYSASWFVRRCLAEFSEAQFYGNEVVGVFVIVGAVIDWVVSAEMPVYGSGLLPGILLSQFIGAAVGVLLYTNKFENGGWYATYVPVVAVGPACVMMFGGSIPVAVFAGAMGGILGGPVAEFFSAKLPEGVHGTNANVMSMALCTIVVAMVMRYIGF